MNKLKNKDGSVILWTIIFTNILVIMLGSLLTLSYGYHNATIETVKKQQAYFTARSVTDSILSDIAVNGEKSQLMPKLDGQKIEVSNISFDNNKRMGSANAEITKYENKVDIKVNSRFTNNTYTMYASMKNQPVYFGGIAVRSLDITDGSKFVLGNNTDLYYDGDDDLNSLIEMEGNLVARHDIHLPAGSKVAGITYTNGLDLDNSSATNAPKKKIWDTDNFIISNYDIDVKYPIRNKDALVTTIKNTLKGNYTNLDTNSTYEHYEYADVDYKGDVITDPNYKQKTPYDEIFGFDKTILTSFKTNDFSVLNNIRYIKITDKDKHGNRGADAAQWTGVRHVYPLDFVVNPIFNGYKYDTIYFTDHNWNSIKKPNYARRLRHAFEFTNEANPFEGWWNDVEKYPHNDNPGSLWNPDGPGINRYFREDCTDIEQIKFDASDKTYWKDEVNSVAYLLIDDNCKVRLQYGIEEEKSGLVKSISDWYKNATGNKLSYIIVYLGENSVLELGDRSKGSYKPDGTIDSNKDLNPDRLHFFMSVYGTDSSKLILNKDCKLYGSVNVGGLEINGPNTGLEFMEQNGGIVSKTKVDNLWTVSNYTD